MATRDDDLRPEGYRVDLSANKTRMILSTRPLRLIPEFDNFGDWHRAQIRYLGRWWDIYRTDLVDGISGMWAERYKSEERARKALIRQVQYGARLQKRGSYFLIVDSLTDG